MNPAPFMRALGQPDYGHRERVMRLRTYTYARRYPEGAEAWAKAGSCSRGALPPWRLLDEASSADSNKFVHTWVCTRIWRARPHPRGNPVSPGGASGRRRAGCGRSGRKQAADRDGPSHPCGSRLRAAQYG